MRYEKIWKKTLGSDETVEFEFSIGDKYRNFWLVVWGILSVPFLFLVGFGVITFLIALFYFGFYLKVANAYAFTNKRVLIHRGWLSTHLTSIDYSKITDVRVEEPFLDRMITQTGNIAINTAGTSFNEVVLKHISRPYETKKQLDVLKDKMHT